MCQLEIPRLQFLARNLHQGHFPLWNPHIWAGQPVLGSAQPGPLYPLNLIFLALPLSGGTLPVPTLNWWFVALHFAGAGFFYLLCRDNRVSRAAALLGAVSFSCCGFLGAVPWLDIGNGLTLTPLVFLFALRLWTRRLTVPNAVLLGVALGMSWLSGHHEIPLLNSYVVVLGTLALAAVRAIRRRLDPRLPALVALALVLAAGISAVQTVPMWEFGRETRRWVGAPDPIGWREKVPYYVHAQYSLAWKDVYSEAPAGLTVTVLALLGLARARSRRWLGITALAGFAGLLYALGAHTPFHRLLYETLPMLDKARTPLRGIYLVSFATSMLGAWGAHLVLRRCPAGRLRVLAGAALLTLVLADAARVSRSRITEIAASKPVCAADLFSHRDLAKRLLADPGLERVAVDWQQLMTSLGDLYGLDQLQGFVAAVPANVLRHELHTPRTRQLFGVTHLVGKTVTPVPGALPRAWVAHEVLFAASEGELRNAIQNPSVDLGRTAVSLTPLPPLERCSDPEPVEIVRPDTDTVVLRANLVCRGLVVVSDTRYPGWKATVDGKPAVIHEVYGAFRGVVVEAGAHTVAMRYQPASVRAGAAGTVVALAGALLLLVFSSPRRRRFPHTQP
jgi:hypothetical protein